MQPSGIELERIARAAKALADPTRVSVAIALRDCGSACGCDVAWIVEREDKLVSHHLRALKAAGAAASRREGKMVIYELTAVGRQMLAVLAGGEVSA